MASPTRCFKCGNLLSEAGPTCLHDSCRIRYGFDQPLGERLILRYGPLFVPGEGGRDAGLYCFAREGDREFRLQSVNWRTGESHSAIALSPHQADYPANVPILAGRRLFVVLGRSYTLAVIALSTTQNPITYRDLPDDGKPLACMLDGSQRPFVVYARKQGLWRQDLDADLRPVGSGQFLAGGVADNQELILINNQRALFRVDNGSAAVVWNLFDANTSQVKSIAAPDIHPVPCSPAGYGALVGHNMIYLIAPDGNMRSAPLPADVTNVSAVAVDEQNRLYFGANAGWGGQAEGAALYYPRRDGVGGYLSKDLPTRPQQIVLLPQPPERALVLSHNRRMGSYLVSVDLVTGNRDTLAVAPPGACGDRLVLQGPAVAFGTGNIIYKRPIYRDLDVRVQPTAKIPPAGTPDRPNPSPDTGKAPPPSAPPPSVAEQPPELNLIIEVIEPEPRSQVNIEDVCLVRLKMSASDGKQRFRIQRIAPASQENRAWSNYSCGDVWYTPGLAAGHDGRVQLIFKQTGQIPVTLEITTEDGDKRWQIHSVTLYSQVVDPLRRPPGTYYNASGDMVVINRS